VLTDRKLHTSIFQYHSKEPRKTVLEDRRKHKNINKMETWSLDMKIKLKQQNITPLTRFKLEVLIFTKNK
jgi:hypothetical protein